MQRLLLLVWLCRPEIAILFASLLAPFYIPLYLFLLTRAAVKAYLIWRNSFVLVILGYVGLAWAMYTNQNAGYIPLLVVHCVIYVADVYSFVENQTAPINALLQVLKE
jgi:hypothetical protein